MPGQSYITVDGSLADSIIEYASVLDLYNKDLNYTAKVESFVITKEEGDEQEDQDEDEEVEFKDEIYAEIAESHKYLAAIPDKDFEGVANLVVYILTFTNDFEKLVQGFLINLIKDFELEDVNNKIVKNKKKTLKVNSIISVLSNIFNLIELENFEFRNFILKLILNLVDILDNGSIVLPIVSNVENWLTRDISTKSTETQEETRLLILQLAKLIASIDELSSLHLYQLAITQIPNASSNLINQFLVENLNSIKALDLTKILELEVVIKNHQESQDYLKILQNYLQLSTVEFQPTLDQFKSNLTTINYQTLLKKNQYLTLAKLALKENSITYSQISSITNIPQEQVELFIIDAIKAKIIEGKLSQINQSFQIYKVNLIVKSIDLNDWVEIKSNLIEWRSKLKDVKSLIDQASKKKIKA